jgi:hypothetical protein
MPETHAPPETHVPEPTCAAVASREARSHAAPTETTKARCGPKGHSERSSGCHAAPTEIRKARSTPCGCSAALQRQVPPPRRWASAAGARGCGRRCSGQVRENATEAGSWRGSPLRRQRGVGSACPCVADQLRGSVHSSTVSNLNRIPLPSRGPDRTTSESRPSGRNPVERWASRPGIGDGRSAPVADWIATQLQPIELPQLRHL